MNLSYWEQKSWFTNIDFAIIGSGIVGLSCALELRELHPEAKIVVFEKGMLPSGASTKNAGFACFGSMSEILQDLETHTPSEVVALISGRLNGLSTLRANLTDQEVKTLRGIITALLRWPNDFKDIDLIKRIKKIADGNDKNKHDKED